MFKRWHDEASTKYMGFGLINVLLGY